MTETFLFTSESVNEGHPDKLCDQVFALSILCMYLVRIQSDEHCINRWYQYGFPHPAASGCAGRVRLRQQFTMLVSHRFPMRFWMHVWSRTRIREYAPCSPQRLYLCVHPEMSLICGKFPIALYVSVSPARRGNVVRERRSCPFEGRYRLACL